MFAIKMIVDNFAACCCSHCIAASIVMSSKIMTEQQCVLKGFKTEDKQHTLKTLK